MAFALLNTIILIIVLLMYLYFRRRLQKTGDFLKWIANDLVDRPDDGWEQRQAIIKKVSFEKVLFSFWKPLVLESFWSREDIEFLYKGMLPELLPIHDIIIHCPEFKHINRDGCCVFCGKESTAENPFMLRMHLPINPPMYQHWDLSAGKGCADNTENKNPFDWYLVAEEMQQENNS